jgi:hypothetical protein
MVGQEGTEKREEKTKDKNETLSTIKWELLYREMYSFT